MTATAPMDLSISSDNETEISEGGFPQNEAMDGVADFGWEDTRTVGGRRKKAQREARKRAKPGSFGE